jgi:hypothetical protein
MRAEVMGEERAELQQIPAYKIPAERKNIKLQEDTDGWMDGWIGRLIGACVSCKVLFDMDI